MHAAAEAFQHGAGFDEIAGFAEGLVSEGDHGVGSQHHPIRKTRADFEGLAFGVDQAEFPRGQGGVREFFDPGRFDLKVQPGLG